jgi:hypothetical protein
MTVKGVNQLFTLTKRPSGNYVLKKQIDFQRAAAVLV